MVYHPYVANKLNLLYVYELNELMNLSKGLALTWICILVKRQRFVKFKNADIMGKCIRIVIWMDFFFTCNYRWKLKNKLSLKFHGEMGLIVE